MSSYPKFINYLTENKVLNLIQPTAMLILILGTVVSLKIRIEKIQLLNYNCLQILFSSWLISFALLSFKDFYYTKEKNYKSLILLL